MSLQLQMLVSHFHQIMIGFVDIGEPSSIIVLPGGGWTHQFAGRPGPTPPFAVVVMYEEDGTEYTGIRARLEIWHEMEGIGRQFRKSTTFWWLDASLHESDPDIARQMATSLRHLDGRWRWDPIEMNTPNRILNILQAGCEHMKRSFKQSSDLFTS